VTYRTPIGDRVVQGAEAEFFREALFWTVHYVTMNRGEDEFNFDAFNRLTYGQQLSGLLSIARAILDETIPPPPPTAATEACTATIFSIISEEVACEIDEDGEEGREKKNIRRAVRAAMIEIGDDEVPESDCTDARIWQNCIDELSESFLFDLDYEDADLYTDLPPEAAQARYRRMNIDPNYFLDVLDDPPESEWHLLEMELHALAKEGAAFQE
jgi:hypothetical protein